MTCWRGCSAWIRANSAGTFVETRRSLQDRLCDASVAAQATRRRVHAADETPPSVTAACRIGFPDTSENRRHTASKHRCLAARLPRALPQVAVLPRKESAHSLAPPKSPTLRRCTAAPTPEPRDEKRQSLRRSVAPSVSSVPITRSQSAWPDEPPTPDETTSAVHPPNGAPPQSCSTSGQIDGSGQVAWAAQISC